MRAGSAEACALRVARGPRALEELLLGEVEGQLAEGPAALAGLAAPVRIVVPSRSLADHVSSALVRRRGRAVLGVSVRSLHAVALEVAARSGQPMAGGEALFPALVREWARREPSLRAELASLDDGYAAVEANVRDLLDAGFEPAHREALADAIAELAGAGPLAARARAVLEVATRVAGALSEGRVAHHSQLLRRAGELLRASPELLPARAILVHGFSDATGVQLDLLEALLRLPGARLFLDRPADPADASRDDPGVRFTRRVAERLAPGPLPPVAPVPGPVALEVVHAPGPEAEVRGVAEGVRALLRAGLVPERIAVVARDLGGYRLPLRRHFRRLGIPFSGGSAHGPPTPAGRRLVGLRALLREGVRLPAEAWLELVALPGQGSPRLRSDVSLALHACGAPRLLDLTRPDVGEACQGNAFELPVRRGLELDAEGGARAPRRRLPGALLRAVLARAAATCERLGAWPERATLGAQLGRLGALLGDLGWREDTPGQADVAALAHTLDAPRAAELEREDFLRLLERELDGAGADALGGAGGGVRVLSVMEARGAAYEALFVLGMNRDLFPRSITEDPLLPDFLRQRLRAVLPDLPVKREGVDEERYLFAQLLAAAPRVVLSCSVTDDDGKRRQPSPLVERLRLAGRHEARRLPSLHGRGRLAAGGAATAAEQALLAGLHGTRRRFAALLPVALAEAWPGAEASLAEVWPGAEASLDGVASARLAVLAELDAPALPQGRLGPYFGFVGARREPADLRGAPLYVTTAEAVARCPWQTFLARLLRLELQPDALAELPPASDPRLLGSLVHRVLEQLARPPGAPERGQPLAQALRATPHAAAWPEAATLERLCLETARSLLRDEGLGFPGYERVLAAGARPLLARAREIGWPGEGVLGVEVDGEVRVRDGSGAPRTLHFRADRVDAGAAGPRLIDFKTGRPAIASLNEAKRRAGLLQALANGTLLQAAAYALGARQAGADAATGEYVFLDPDADPRAARLRVAAADAEVEHAFDESVAALLELWQRGSFFPRLVEPEGGAEARQCAYCEVREACWRGDSGARARLFGWAQAQRARPAEELAPAERALLGLWQRGAP
jgi:RecB family exonuclease